MALSRSTCPLTRGRPVVDLTTFIFSSSQYWRKSWAKKAEPRSEMIQAGLPNTLLCPLSFVTTSVAVVDFVG